jgi:hypothetical protein
VGDSYVDKQKTFSIITELTQLVLLQDGLLKSERVPSRKKVDWMRYDKQYENWIEYIK